MISDSSSPGCGDAAAGGAGEACARTAARLVLELISCRFMILISFMKLPLQLRACAKRGLSEQWATQARAGGTLLQILAWIQLSTQEKARENL
jgi:hypothetical protein